MICIKIFISYENKIKLWQLYPYLITVLKEALKVSKDPKSEISFVDEALSLNFLEYLLLIKPEISNEENSEEKLEILNLLIATLKNNASNKDVRKKFFEKKNLEIFNHYFHFFTFDEKKMNEIEMNIKSAELDKRFY